MSLEKWLPVVSLVSSVAGLTGGGGFLFYRLMRKEREVDISAKLQKLSDDIMKQYDEYRARTDQKFETVREYLVADAKYHENMGDQLRTFGGDIGTPPKVPNI